MADNALHYTPLPKGVMPQPTAENNAGSGGLKKRLPFIIVGILTVIALILGVFYYINVVSVPTQPTVPEPTAPNQESPESPSTDEVQLFEAEEQGSSCLDWAKYKARLDQIGMTCAPGCCPWTSDPDDPPGCKAPGDNQCKPKGNPCSDATCWECRFEREGLRFIRYEGNEWISCSSEPTPSPTIPPISGCPNPNQCLPLNECETPPASINPGNQCANNLYCCKPKSKITATLTPPPACTKPKIDVEVQCLQCDGAAITQ